MGTLMVVDEGTKSIRASRICKLCLRLPFGCSTTLRKEIKVNGEVYYITLEKEMGTMINMICICGEQENSMSEGNSTMDCMDKLTSKFEYCERR